MNDSEACCPPSKYRIPARIKITIVKVRWTGKCSSTRTRGKQKHGKDDSNNNNTTNNSHVDRFTVPGHLVSWDKLFKNYRPVNYSLKFLLGKTPVCLNVTQKEKFAEIELKCLHGTVDNTVSSDEEYDNIDMLLSKGQHPFPPSPRKSAKGPKGGMGSRRFSRSKRGNFCPQDLQKVSPLSDEMGHWSISMATGGVDVVPNLTGSTVCGQLGKGSLHPAARRRKDETEDIVRREDARKILSWLRGNGKMLRLLRNNEKVNLSSTRSDLKVRRKSVAYCGVYRKFKVNRCCSVAMTMEREYLFHLTNTWESFQNLSNVTSYPDDGYARQQDANSVTECQHCKKPYTCVEDYDVHIIDCIPKSLLQKESGSKKLYSSDKESRTSSSSKKHTKKRSESRNHQCNICQKLLDSYNDIVEHTKTHMGEHFSKCIICSKDCTFNCLLLPHLRRHTGDRPHRCPECSKPFTTKAEVYMHMKIHTNEKTFRCEECRKQFTYKSNLVQHMRVHSGDRPYACSLCSTSFNQLSCLSTHMKSHTNDRRQKCPWCEKGFVGKGDLNKHIRVHTNERPYACAVCNKAFKAHAHLSAHMKIHAAGRMYTCDACDKRFTKRDLKIHERVVHAGKKIHKCLVCGKEFVKRSNFSRHTMTHVKEEESS